jgi:hypothetical protein
MEKKRKNKKTMNGTLFPCHWLGQDEQPSPGIFFALLNAGLEGKV